MDTYWPLEILLHGLSEGNYDRTFSAYRFWVGLRAARGGMSTRQLYNDILSNTKPHLITIPYEKEIPQEYALSLRPKKYMEHGQLIHSNVHLLLRFISDAEVDPTLSTYAIGLHDQLCHDSLDQFFKQNLDYLRFGPTPEQLREFYTRVNLIGHWVNLGHAKLEDIRDHILQSLIVQDTVHLHQLSSLMILLKISGATFAAYVDPEVMDRCCDLLKPSNLNDDWALSGLAKVSALLLEIKINYECSGL